MKRWPQTNLNLSDTGREELRELADRYGWSMAETVERAVRVLGPMVESAIEEARKIGGEQGELLERIARDFTVAAFFDKDKQGKWVRSDLDGRIGLKVDDRILYIGPDDQLTVTRHFEDRVEMAVVKRSRPVPVGVFPRGEPSLN